MRPSRSVPLHLLLLGLAACDAADPSTDPSTGALATPRSPRVIDQYIAERLAETDRIPADRCAAFDELAGTLRQRLATTGELDMTFICTHNSRRSHMSQLWAKAAADHFGVAGVRTWSGGTESTAFNPRAVAAMERAGFAIEKTSDTDNPVYAVRIGADGEPMRCWSKRFDDPANPQTGFVAFMTCDSADGACPIVAGAAHRVAITYEDPKAFDWTDREAAAYDERCAQIAREMLYLFGRVAAAD